jgi:hypothetical protein
LSEEEAFERAKAALHDAEDSAFAKVMASRGSAVAKSSAAHVYFVRLGCQLEKLLEQAQKFSDPGAYLPAEMAEEVRADYAVPLQHNR